LLGDVKEPFVWF